MISNTGGLGKISPEIALLDKPGCGPLVGLVKKIDLIKLDGGVGRDAKKWVQPSISEISLIRVNLAFKQSWSTCQES